MNAIFRFANRHSLSLLAMCTVWSARLYAGDFFEEMQRQTEIDSLRLDIQDTQAEIETGNIQRDWNEMDAKHANKALYSKLHRMRKQPVEDPAD